LKIKYHKALFGETKEVYGYDLRYGFLPPTRIFNALDLYDEKKPFYQKLRLDIKNNGLLNPLLVSSGYCLKIRFDKLPEYMKEDTNSILVCDRFGGSRLSVAILEDIPLIPVIIEDWNERFFEYPEIFNVAIFRSLFNNVPKFVELSPKGLFLGGMKHIHLKKD